MPGTQHRTRKMTKKGNRTLGGTPYRTPLFLTPSKIASERFYELRLTELNKIIKLLLDEKLECVSALL